MKNTKYLSSALGMAWVLALLGCSCSTDKATPSSGVKPVTQSPQEASGSPAEGFMTVAIEPKDKLVNFIYSTNGPEVATHYPVPNGESFVQCETIATKLTIYHDPTPDMQLIANDPSGKNPSSEVVPPLGEGDNPPPRDTSDWQLLATLDLPAAPCNQRLLKLQYTFGDKVSVKAQLLDK